MRCGPDLRLNVGKVQAPPGQRLYIRFGMRRKYRLQRRNMSSQSQPSMLSR